jgi:hypothetical protein
MVKKTNDKKREKAIKAAIQGLCSLHPDKLDQRCRACQYILANYYDVAIRAQIDSDPDVLMPSRKTKKGKKEDSGGNKWLYFKDGDGEGAKDILENWQKRWRSTWNATPTESKTGDFALESFIACTEQLLEAKEILAEAKSQKTFVLYTKITNAYENFALDTFRSCRLAARNNPDIDRTLVPKLLKHKTDLLNTIKEELETDATTNDTDNTTNN